MTINTREPFEVDYWSDPAWNEAYKAYTEAERIFINALCALIDTAVLERFPTARTLKINGNHEGYDAGISVILTAVLDIDDLELADEEELEVLHQGLSPLLVDVVELGGDDYMGDDRLYFITALQ